MLFAHGSRFIPGYILISVVLFLSAARAYRVNAKRPDDDPKKRDFHIAAVFLTPITWSGLIVLSIMLLIIEAMAFMLFLILFTISVIIFRKPFVLIWLDRIAIKIGNYFLEANTMLIRAFIGRKVNTPQT